MRYLLDTCVISDFFKKVPATVEHFKRVSSTDLSISTVTVFEIEYELKLNPERESKLHPLWKDLAEEITVIPFDCNEAISTALIRLRLRTQTIGAYDCMIAGTALAHNMILVTSNMREFNRLSDIIMLEDWRLQH